MITLLLNLLRVFPVFCGDHRQLALENLALRQQLAVYKRTVAPPRLRTSDRLFWVCLSRLGGNWRSSLLIVQPATGIAWHRQGFRLYWRWKSPSDHLGRTG
jgi:putative transposase